MPTDTEKVDIAVAALVSALGYTEEEVSQIDVIATGRIRVFMRDRSLRSHRITPLRAT